MPWDCNSHWLLDKKFISCVQKRHFGYMKGSSCVQKRHFGYMKGIIIVSYMNKSRVKIDEPSNNRFHSPTSRR